MLDGVKIRGLSKSSGRDPSLLFFNSHPDISLSQPLTLLLVVQLTPVSVGSRWTQALPPLLPPRPSQFSTSCLLHTTTSTSVSTLSADRKQLHCCSMCVTGGGGDIRVRCAFISMEAPSMCFVNKARGECLLYRTYETIWIDKKTARSGRALLGCGARGNAISFWCSCSAKQTLCAMPPG